jgi:uncharacterized cupin superfamily protein
MTSVTTNRLGQAPEEGVKAPVTVATIANLTLTGLPIISGYQLVARDRVLVKSQTDGTENGIYIAAAGAWSRSNDWNKNNDIINGQLVVDANSGLLYRTNFSGTFAINTTSTTFIVADTNSISRHLDSVSDMVADTTLQLGEFLHLNDYADGRNAGPLFFKIVAAGTGTADGGEFIDLPNTTPALQAQQSFPTKATVMMYGADGDAIADDTTEIDNFQADTLTNEEILFPRTSASYLMGAVEIDKALTMKGGGKFTLSGASAGFELKANMSGFTMSDLELVGDGVVGSLHRALWNSGSFTLTKMLVTNIKATLMVQGLDVAKFTDSVISFNYVSDSVGTASGQGYGIVSGQSKRCPHIGNILTGNKRHGAYQNDVEFNPYIGNVFFDHRTGEAGGGTAAALSLAREFKGIPIVGQVFARGKGPGLRIDSDSVANETGKVASTTGCIFYENDGAELQIGAQTPSATSNVEGISSNGDSFYPVATRQNGFISLTSGLGVSLKGGHIWAPNGTVASYIGIVLDTAATNADDFYDNLSIRGFTGKIASSGGATTFLNIGAKLCVGTTRIDIFDNDIEADDLISYVTNPPTNPNIRTDDQTELAITLAIGSQTVNIAGYNRFVITGNAKATGTHDGAGNAAVLTDSGQAWTVNELIGLKLKNTTDGSTTTITANTATTVTGVLAGGTDDDWDASDAYAIESPITDFINHHGGKEIELRFTDATAEITRSNANLEGGVNFVSSNRDIVELKRIGSVWIQTGGSVNN